MGNASAPAMWVCCARRESVVHNMVCFAKGSESNCSNSMHVVTREYLGVQRAQRKEEDGMRRRERITKGQSLLWWEVAQTPEMISTHVGVVCWVCSVASIISHCGSSSRLGNGCLGTWPVVSSFLCHLFSSFMEELPAAVLGAVPLASFAVCVCSAGLERAA